MYKNELEFSKIISDRLSERGFLTKTEIDSGYGIADVVAIKINKTNVEKRLGYKQISVLDTESYFKVLQLIGEDTTNAISSKEIISKVSFSDSYVRATILKTLLNKKFVKKVDKDTYVKINGWAPLSSEIIAIESKLGDWNRGITQALRYKTFADRVYLALPETKIHLADRITMKKLNVGLITLTGGKVNFLFNPVKQNARIIPSKQNYVCEYFWDDMLKFA